jgi:hypothetical protein
VLRLLVTEIVVPSTLTLVTLMMEAIGSSETSVLRATQCYIPEYGIVQSSPRKPQILHVIVRLGQDVGKPAVTTSDHGRGIGKTNYTE